MPIELTDDDRCYCNHFPDTHHPLDGCIHCGQCTEYVRRGGPRPEIDRFMSAQKERWLKMKGAEVGDGGGI
jgi:hypothetical protein